MNLLEYITKSTNDQAEIVIPRAAEVTRSSIDVHSEPLSSNKAVLSKLGIVVRDTLQRTGLSYAELRRLLAEKDIKISLASLHSLSTNPDARFVKYDTSAMINKLDVIRKKFDTGETQAWIDKDDVKDSIKSWLEHPAVIEAAKLEHKRTGIFLRNIMGLADNRLKFSQWKNGRYKVRSHTWTEATSKVKALINY